MPPEPATQWRPRTLASSGGTGSGLHHDVVCCSGGSLLSARISRARSMPLTNSATRSASKSPFTRTEPWLRMCVAHRVGVELVGREIGDAGGTVGVEVGHRHRPPVEADVGGELGEGLVPGHGQAPLELGVGLDVVGRSQQLDRLEGAAFADERVGGAHRVGGPLGRDVAGAHGWRSS